MSADRPKMRSKKSRPAARSRTGTPVKAISTSIAASATEAGLHRRVDSAAAGSSRATWSDSGRPTGRRRRGAEHRASRRAGARRATTDRPASVAAPLPRARSPVPAPRARPERAPRGRPTSHGRVRPRRQIPEPVRQHHGIHRPRRHELDVPVQGVGQPHGEVGRPHPDPFAQLGQPAVGEGPAPGAPDVGRAARRRHDGQPPRPSYGAVVPARLADWRDWRAARCPASR